MRKVLVTGGAGYIGSTLVPMLLEHHYKVTVLDNFMYGNRDSLSAVLQHPRLEIIRRDVTQVEPAFYGQFDILIPLAAIVGAPACDKDKLRAAAVNSGAISRMVAGARKDAFLAYPNTNSQYGFSETICTEESPAHPISVYGKTKCEGERIALSHPNSCVFRLATVFSYSPRMRLDLMVADFCRRAIWDRHIQVFEGHFRRNFVAVKDVARAFLWAIDRNLRGPFNLGLDQANMSKWELANKVADMVGGCGVSEGEGRDPDQRSYEISNKRILDTGFSFKYSLEGGIIETIKFIRTIEPSERGFYSNV